MAVKFFADSSFLTGLMSKKDDYSRDANDLFEYIKQNHLASSISDFQISNYIIIEVIHNLMDQHMKFTEIMEYYEELKKCKTFHIKPRDIDYALNSKLRCFCSHRTQEPKMGIVDATSLVVMEKKRINYIISFDEDFRDLPLISQISDKEGIDEKILFWHR